MYSSIRKKALKLYCLQHTIIGQIIDKCCGCCIKRENSPDELKILRVFSEKIRKSFDIKKQHKQISYLTRQQRFLQLKKMAMLKKTQQVFVDGMDNQPASTIESGKRKVF